MNCQGNLYNCHHCKKPACRDIRGMIEGIDEIFFKHQGRHVRKILKLMQAKIEKLEGKK